MEKKKTTPKVIPAKPKARSRSRTINVQKKPTLWEKIFNVQQAVGLVEKTGTNEHHHYKYAKEVDVISVVKPQLGIQRLVVTSTTVSHEVNDKMKKIGIEFTIRDIDSGESTASTFYGEGEDKSGSTVGTPIAYTMALKYYLAKMFMLETGDDAELEKRKAKGANETPEVKFDKANKLLAKMKDQAGLISYSESLKDNKTFTDDQKKVLQATISSRIDELNADQTTDGK